MDDEMGEDIDRLFRLTDQLCAATIIAGDEMFLRWNGKIQQNYLGLIDDLADSLHDTVEKMFLQA